MRTALKSKAWLAAGAIVAGASLLGACDRSAQSSDGAVGENQVGTAAYTPTGQVVPTTGSNTEKLDAPEIAPVPADGAAAPAK
jgi:hypothetical protein